VFSFFHNFSDPIYSQLLLPALDAMENTKPVVEDEPLWLCKMKPEDRQKAREVALAMRDQVMRSHNKCEIPLEELEEEPSPEWMMQADAELQACHDQFRECVIEVEVC
jgi:hypothetical protein